MRSILMMLALCLGLASAPARAAEIVSDADAQSIRGVIEAQMAAFGRDDAGAAFAFASPGIQRMFGTPERFIGMVKSGYEAVYRPREVEFRDIVDYQGRPTQRVLVVGPDGVPQVAYYMMQQQPDGSWRIDGCVLMGSTEATT